MKAIIIILLVVISVVVRFDKYWNSFIYKKYLF